MFPVEPYCVFISSPPVPLSQALEGAPSDQLMQQSQMAQYYTQQPWVPKTCSISHPPNSISQTSFHLISSFILSFHPM